MGGNLLLWLFYFFTFYAFLPGLLSRLFGFRVIKRGSSDKEISLTFDDGPDPVHTPLLLDLLREYGMKATFFLVGQHAEQYPDIVRRMHAEGHLIGIHNYKHRPNWLMRPRTVEEHIRKTSRAIERITGEKPSYYRPPWGIMNMFDFTTKSNLQIVLWSVMVGDWRKKTGPDKIYRKMKRTLKGGHIYLLHDCGSTFGADPEAPENTIGALKRFLPEAIESGYRFVRVDELVQVSGRMVNKKDSWGKRMLVRLWLLWEQCFHVLFRLQSAAQEKSGSFLHYRLIDYHGDPMVLPEGETVRKGDRVVELHMNNALLYEFGRRARSPVQLAIQLIRAMEQTMPQLAASLLSHKDIRSIKAVIGTTMVHRGVEQFGFQVEELPKGWFAFSSKLYLRLLLSVIHPQGADRLAERKEMLVPKRIVISMNEIVRRYGGAGPSGSAGETAVDSHFA